MKELSKELQLKRIEKNKEAYFSKTLKLGQGAFGEVFLGFDETMHLPFACKVISLEKINLQANQESIIKKVKDEIVNMQIARNEHIVEFYQAKTYRPPHAAQNETSTSCASTATATTSSVF